jgi:CheY-like chemotaxis protein
MRFVVCDDDDTVRDVVADLLAQEGHSVVAEADSALAAVELMDRHRPDGVIVDLSLRFGSGPEVLAVAARMGCPAIVFSSYVEGFDAKTGPGAPIVVEKPDFVALLAAVSAVAGRARGWDGQERRRPTPSRPRATATGLADDATAFYRALERAQADDALVVVDPDDPATVPRLLMAVRSAIRAHDVAMIHRGRVFALMVGGGPDAPGSMSERLNDAWHPTVTAAHGMVGDYDSPSEAFLALRHSGGPDATGSG